jgi:hypothetical protein
MRALILLLISFPVFGKCLDYDKLADVLNTKKFVKISREARDLKKEAHIELSDINQAKTIAYRFPAFEEMGFGKAGGEGWKPYSGRLEKSALYGKKIGWEVKNDKGYARLRLDWDPQKGGHYNIEITEKTQFGKSETHKLAVGFQCANKPCTQEQVLKMAERMQ